MVIYKLYNSYIYILLYSYIVVSSKRSYSIIMWLYSCYGIVCWCGVYHGQCCNGFIRWKTSDLSDFRGGVDTLYHCDNTGDCRANCVRVSWSFFMVVMV